MSGKSLHEEGRFWTGSQRTDKNLNGRKRNKENIFGRGNHIYGGIDPSRCGFLKSNNFPRWLEWEFWESEGRWEWRFGRQLECSLHIGIGDQLGRTGMIP